MMAVFLCRHAIPTVAVPAVGEAQWNRLPLLRDSRPSGHGKDSAVGHRPAVLEVALMAADATGMWPFVDAPSELAELMAPVRHIQRAKRARFEAE